jgi:serine/threonine protein kinase
VHRDVKLENFLCFKSGDAKLSDFGFATKLARGDKLISRVGSPTYVAPGEEYDEKVDVWSFGVCVFTLLTSCKPFETQDYGTLDPVALRRWRALVGSLSESQRAAVVRALRADPENRASAARTFSSCACYARAPVESNRNRNTNDFYFLTLK